MSTGANATHTLHHSAQRPFKMHQQGLPNPVIVVVLEFLVAFKDTHDIQNFALTCKHFHSHVKAFVNRYIEATKRDNSFLSLLTIDEHVNRLFSVLRIPKVLFIGGTPDSRRCDIFEPLSGKFRKACGLNMKRSDDFDAIFHQGLVFVVSGLYEATTSTVECYHPAHDAWTTMGQVPERLVAISCASIGNDLYVIGGANHSLGVKSTTIFRLCDTSKRALLDLYSPSGWDQVQQADMLAQGPCWEDCEGALSAGRSHHASINYKSSIWIAGGFVTGNSQATNTVEIFDPVTTATASGPSMKRHRLRPRLIVLSDSLFAVGGDVDGYRPDRDTIERFNDVQREWELLTFFPLSRPRAVCFGFQNAIFVFGGEFGTSSRGSWDVYNIRSGLWASETIENIKEHRPQSLIEPKREKSGYESGQQQHGTEDQGLTGSFNYEASARRTFPGREAGLRNGVACWLHF